MRNITNHTQSVLTLVFGFLLPALCTVAAVIWRICQEDALLGGLVFVFIMFFIVVFACIVRYIVHFEESI